MLPGLTIEIGPHWYRASDILHGHRATKCRPILWDFLFCFCRICLVRYSQLDLLNSTRSASAQAAREPFVKKMWEYCVTKVTQWTRNLLNSRSICFVYSMKINLNLKLPLVPWVPEVFPRAWCEHFFGRRILDWNRNSTHEKSGYPVRGWDQKSWWHIQEFLLDEGSCRVMTFFNSRSPFDVVLFSSLFIV